MLWIRRWIIIVALCALCGAQTVCNDESCRCDASTRVICNCTRDYDEVTLRPDGPFRVPSTTTAIIINGCARVFFLPYTVKELPNLRNVELTNNRHIHFDSGALVWVPYQRQLEIGLRININNCTIDEIASHAVRGRIDDIIISNSRINMIRAFAFSSLNGAKNILLTGNTFEDIEIQAFKQFSTENFILRGGVIKNALPSRFLSDVRISNLLHIDGVIVNSMSSLAFLVNSPTRVLIESNIIGILEGDAFHVSTRGPITLRNNTITALRKNALLGFNVEREIISDVGLQELLMDNNTITDLTPASLAFNRSSLTFRIDGLNLNMTCSCDLAIEWQLIIQQGGIISCWYILENHYVSISTYVDSRCGTIKENFWIFIIIGVVVVLIIGIIIAYFVVRRENMKKKKLPIVLPDGKTYKETELYVLTEKVDLLTTDL